MTPPVLLIKSASDIGSAVAHRLRSAGYRVVLWELAAPGATRRLMSFAGAVHAGRAELEGLTAVRCPHPDAALAALADPACIPLLVADALDAPPPLPLAVLVDARMRKKHEPPVQIALAPLVIGIGPGFTAGVHCHVVIESNWGQRLGAVITHGGSEPYTGKHRVVAGAGRERYVYAPHDGVFRTERALLEAVQPGAVVGRVGETPLRAETGGILRGLAYDGLAVAAGAKLVEVDPAGDPANARGIGARQARIADGVLEAVRRAD